MPLKDRNWVLWALFCFFVPLDYDFLSSLRPSKIAALKGKEKAYLTGDELNPWAVISTVSHG